MVRGALSVAVSCLLVGALAACAPGASVASAGGSAAVTGAADTTDALLAAIGDRLLAGEEVAAYKQQQGLPIDDPAREAEVIAAAGPAAAAAGVDAGRTEAVVQAQIAASKTAQVGWQRLWAAGTASAPPAPSLDHARTAISTATTAIVTALASPVGCPLGTGRVDAVVARLTATGLDAAISAAAVAQATAPLCT